MIYDSNLAMHIGHTYWIKIYISGPISLIEHCCRKYCTEKGLCVTVNPTKFIYKGGEEVGAEIGLISYPKYPASKDELKNKAFELADEILIATYQDSVLIMTPESTHCYTKRTKQGICNVSIGLQIP
jgi:hypothetical protein